MRRNSSGHYVNTSEMFEGLDADLMTVAEDLESIYAPPVPPVRIAEFNVPPPTSAHRWRFGRTGAIAAMLCIVIIATGAGYAMRPILEEAFELNPETSQAITDGLGTEVAVSQSIDGFIMTVERVYADLDEIIIGFTISSPPDREFNYVFPWGEYSDATNPATVRAPILTDSRGTPISGGFAPIMPEMTTDGNTAGVLIYSPDVGLVPQDADSIDVQLTVNTLMAYERIGEDEYRDIVLHSELVFDLTIPLERDQD